jgi:hypothetical protein
MPFKSQAQRAKMAVLEKEGKVKKGTVAKWNAETPKGKLPERVGKKKITSVDGIVAERKKRYGV